MDRQVAEVDKHACPALEIDRTRVIVRTNAAADAAGIRAGEYCWDAFGKQASIGDEEREYFRAHGRVPEAGIRCTFCRADRALGTGEHVIERIALGGTWFESHWEPTGRGTYLHYAVEVAEQ